AKPQTYSTARTQESSPRELRACSLSLATTQQSLPRSPARQATTGCQTIRTQPTPAASQEDSPHAFRSWPAQRPETESRTSPRRAHSEASESAQSDCPAE